MSATPGTGLRPDRVTIPRHVVFRSFVEETVVLNLDSGRYHGLNPTAGRMLELLGELGEIDAVAARVADETGAPPSRVADDLRGLCASLQARGLIEVEPAT
jgi:Coenzyme PQQ synthesis protein D (PqqD)